VGNGDYWLCWPYRFGSARVTKESCVRRVGERKKGDPKAALSLAPATIVRPVTFMEMLVMPGFGQSPVQTNLGF
jgi:hypothetical protein